ncbi:hypothetical protein [Streptomyces sp. NPDC058632]
MLSLRADHTVGSHRLTRDDYAVRGDGTALDTVGLCTTGPRAP